MSSDVFFELHQGLPREGPGRNRYTRKAYRMLPRLHRPRILDVGCGPGAPTLELARLSRGEVTGVDVHQPYLDELQRRAEGAGLSGRVHALNRSMFDLGFPDGSFDVVWAEGSIFIIGFEKGLTEWRRLVRPGGFLAVHEMVWLRPDPPREILEYWRRAYPGISTVEHKLDQVAGCGYTLLGHFALPEDAWWVEYYGPLERRIAELRPRYAGNAEALAVLDAEQQEIDLFRRNMRWYGSAFFVMQKGDETTSPSPAR